MGNRFILVPGKVYAAHKVHLDVSIHMSSKRSIQVFAVRLPMERAVKRNPNICPLASKHHPLDALKLLPLLYPICGPLKEPPF